MCCGPFSKNKGRIKKFIKTRNTNFILKNELGKACFRHDIAYDKSKDLTKRIPSDKFLKVKAFKTASDPKYEGYEKRLASMFSKFFDKKSSGSGAADSLANKSPTEANYQPENELHR